MSNKTNVWKPDIYIKLIYWLLKKPSPTLSQKPKWGLFYLAKNEYLCIILKSKSNDYRNDYYTKIFRVNKKWNLNDMITESQINDVVYKIANFYQPEKIILFGSYATQTANENSDLDLLIVKNSNLPRPQRNIEIWKELRKEKYYFPIDILVYTHSEIEKEKKSKYTFVYEALNKGKIVYEYKQ